MKANCWICNPICGGRPMKGYFGKFLKIDLTSGQTDELTIKDDDLKTYVGGSTLAARLIYDYVKPGMDPPAPENPIVFATGPFTGSNVPMVSRAAICGISPGTGLWGEATTGGKFPMRLKGTGFDGILITGKAKKPVYVYVKDGTAEIRNASHLWGTGDIYTTQEKIKTEVDDKASIACIGEGGERLIHYANIINDEGRAAGRCGMGALMGSKNLKALVVSGNRKTPISDPEKLKQTIAQARDSIQSNA
ncbi:MAG: aldehyde ferredoxin oxidoreductase, partial [Desulfobacterales bacterium CG23_combo_of_CG06-09_8_20_14_all_51_8]